MCGCVCEHLFGAAALWTDCCTCAPQGWSLQGSSSSSLQSQMGHPCLSSSSRHTGRWSATLGEEATHWEEKLHTGKRSSTMGRKLHNGRKSSTLGVEADGMMETLVFTEFYTLSFAVLVDSVSWDRRVSVRSKVRWPDEGLLDLVSDPSSEHFLLHEDQPTFVSVIVTVNGGPLHPSYF